MGSAIDTEIYVHELNETLTDLGAHTIYTFFGHDLQDTGDSPPTGITTPDPIIYNNGVVVNPADYTLNEVTGQVTFDSAQGASDVITADYTWLLSGTDIHDCSTFNWSETLNRTTVVDVNGRVPVVTARIINQPFIGELSFEIVTDTIFDYIRHLAITRNLTFDIYRVSVTSDYSVIAGLVAMTSPAYQPIPGTPNCLNITFTAQQLETV